MNLLDFLFPPSCIGCGKIGKYFCDFCRIKIKPFKNQVCPVCEKPAIFGKTHPFCQRELGIDGLISVFPYRGIIKEAIVKLKYKFVSDLADELFAFMKHIIEVNENNVLSLEKSKFRQKKVVLLPVPLHRRRLLWRGFNQAEILGEILAKHFNWQFRLDILIRRKSTKPQVGLRGNQRLDNVQNAFVINPNSKFLILNSKLLLFDDVWTTGSTLKECCQVLKKAGAKDVWGMTIAR